MVYKTKFTKNIEINSKKDAYYVILHFCDNCLKSASSRFHCPYCDSIICDKEKEKIVTDFKSGKV